MSYALAKTIQKTIYLKQSRVVIQLIIYIYFNITKVILSNSPSHTGIIQHNICFPNVVPSPSVYLLRVSVVST